MERAFATDATSRFAIRCLTDAALDSPRVATSRKSRSRAARGTRVLLLDEPTQGIDVAGRAEIHRLIAAEASRGTAILLASSDLGEILELSDRIAVMRAGRLVATLPGDASGEAVLAHAIGATGRT
jgi:ABC-type sugar transport system ATPase subunit